MIEFEEFFHQCEASFLSQEMSLCPSLCLEFEGLDPTIQLSFKEALNYLGCDDIKYSNTLSKETTSAIYRIKAARLMLLSLYIATGDPRWSSKRIDDMWLAVINVPQGSVVDLFQSLSDILDDFALQLTPNIIQFIHAVTYKGRIQFFQQFRFNYNQSDFSWLQNKAETNMTQAQAYLFAHVILIDELTFKPSTTINILRLLIGHTTWDTVTERLKPAIQTPYGQVLLKQWLQEQTDDSLRERILSLIS